MRKVILIALVLTSGVIFAARLFYLQVLDSSSDSLYQNSAIKVMYDYPQRGYMFDRNDKLLVSNQPSYDVMVIPREVKTLDTLEFCNLLKISKEDFIEIMKKAKRESPRSPSVVIPQFNKADYASLSEKMYKYQGFYIQRRSLREYQVDHSANVMGYIAEVNNAIIEKNPYYQMGELIGTVGVEKEYEEVLRGVKGVKYIQKDRFNRDIGPYKEGIFDTLPERGSDVQLTIDAALQKYGQELMVHKRGGIVAIEPATGEILALITAPSYDPSLLVGRDRSKNFTKLWYDTIGKPLYDRVLMGEYPPGSPFKTLTALVGLQENAIGVDDVVTCTGGYHFGRRVLRCHHRGPVAMISGIANSCNTYFCTVYKRMMDTYPTPQEGIDAWRKDLMSFGLGDFLGYDLPSGKRGNIPTSKYYNKIHDFPVHNWSSLATISNAIGQGEVLLTPIQMANFTAAIANRGYYYTPHVIKNIIGPDTIPAKFKEKHHTTVDPKYFEPVVEGMFQVYERGTAASIRVPGIEVCGKTGTAENYTKIDGKRVQLTDHSIFVAFAPKDNPKIAIAVFVENGYWGSRWAGRIAGLMIEKYLKGEITRTDMEKYVLAGNLEAEYAKQYSGQPFSINH
ncbi:penicillin-binding protein 2 [Aequorivita sublithincola DSM 14238]|uniref:Penicillin-binding protein 2 n=1 Tax=Aequorivita sublithincola (strain DSM 14238 / LMG 21431 / ACAM 643 / 9-3) TaxID=746697 RepID=I3YSV5_AEQSU|nr:penicillin-binding protein 2 [Aequorivita sublithincola]AFL80073.1 penicillin-binding protein 2 [Aequorivita sublithincola DSM 14238]